jgi:polyhydroxybutyrate depolymerase
VFGGGHTWPGSAPAPGWAEVTTQEFDAAEEICRFAEPLLIAAKDRRIAINPGGCRGELWRWRPA